VSKTYVTPLVKWLLSLYLTADSKAEFVKYKPESPT
jgi:hypothetical protein